MAKKNGAGRFDSPGNLWGKPLGRPTSKPVEEEVTGMRSDDSDSMEEEELDVDAELADADEQEDDIDDEEENEDEDSDAVAEDDVEDDEVDDDGLTYAPEAGDAPAEEKTVVSAVDDDEVDEEEETADDQELAAEPTESRIRNMADKKKVSLSDHIRNEIDKRKDAGTSLRGVDIVAALEKRGINVSAAQVSQLLKKAGLGGKPRKRKEAAAESGGEKIRAAEKAKKREDAPTAKARTGRPVTTPEPRAAAKLPSKTNGFKVPMAQLQAAEAFVDACGGSFKDAERILLAASQLSQTFGG